MKNTILISFILMMLTLTSCEVIGDIFSAGFYTALFLVVLVVAVVIYIISRFRRR